MVIIPTFNLDSVKTPTIGGDSALFYFLGEAHTVDNIFGYIPSEKTLFGGCAVKEHGGSRGYVGDANIQEWSKTVETARAKFPQVKIVVPGHGKVGGAELLTYTIDVFDEYRLK